MVWPTVKVFPARYTRQTRVRVKQLARRKTITPGGKECKFNEIIPADHCLHDVQDMSGYHHPAADLHKGNMVVSDRDCI